MVDGDRRGDTPCDWTTVCKVHLFNHTARRPPSPVVGGFFLLSTHTGDDSTPVRGFILVEQLTQSNQLNCTPRMHQELVRCGDLDGASSVTLYRRRVVRSVWNYTTRSE